MILEQIDFPSQVWEVSIISCHNPINTKSTRASLSIKPRTTMCGKFKHFQHWFCSARLDTNSLELARASERRVQILVKIPTEQTPLRTISPCSRFQPLRIRQLWRGRGGVQWPEKEKLLTKGRNCVPEWRKQRIGNFKGAKSKFVCRNKSVSRKK